MDGVNAWPNRASILKDNLLSYNPDIICTQEGRKPQLKELELLLNDFQIIDQNRQWIDDRMYPTIYIKKNRFNIIESGDFWLSTKPYIPASSSFKSQFPRLCTWVRLIDNISLQSMFISNIHLDHVLEFTRVEQIRVFIKEIKKINQQLCPQILCGDFNSGPNETVRDVLSQEFPLLSDPWSLHQSIEEPSFHFFDGINPQGSRIDWIMADPYFNCHEIFLDKGHYQNRYPSDHFPVKAKFSF